MIFTQIGSHSFSHADLALLGDSDLYDQVKQNEDAIYNVIGKRPKHFRLPYLSYNERVLAALGSWGYTVIGVNLDTKDYAHNNQPNEMSLNQDAYLAVMSQNPRSVISLNHDFTRGCAQWLEMMIDDARSRGFAFVTTEECTNIKGY
jgi:peptidoglycan/xylan/chitin deacetylase (PgdA/CDA1 family)